MHIRKAIISDVNAIHELLNQYAAQGLLLPRSLSEIYAHLRDFFVLEEGGKDHQIQGACGLGICWEDLAEIKSLAVSKKLQGHGFGSELVNECLKEAQSLGLNRIFTLTYVPQFFTKLGFIEADKSNLPHKVWADCLKCSKFPNCDETALVIDL